MNVNGGLGRSCKRSWPVVRDYKKIYLDGRNKTTKHQSG
jgi:hypothetical protein